MLKSIIGKFWSIIDTGLALAIHVAIEMAEKDWSQPKVRVQLTEYKKLEIHATIPVIVVRDNMTQLHHMQNTPDYQKAVIVLYVLLECLKWICNSSLAI